jgi:hypothetical protein
MHEKQSTSKLANELMGIKQIDEEHYKKKAAVLKLKE